MAIVSATIGLARRCTSARFAEGVETEREILRQHGCARVQGFLIAEPMPATSSSDQRLWSGAGAGGCAA